jgi:steroid delta-isomerase-like uncharacterized protein
MNTKPGTLALGAAIGLLAIGLSACGREDPQLEKPPAAPTATAIAPSTTAVREVAPPPPAAAGSPRQVLDAWLAAWNAHDMQRAGALLADDVEYFDAGFSGIQRGRDAAIENGVSVFMRGVPDLHWELRGEPVASADAVAWEWTFTGTNTGTWGGIPATRQAITLKGVSVLRLRGGKISHVATYYDTGTLNRQLGL